MHRIIEDGLEEYLAGRPETGALREFQNHLRECSLCRQEVAEMQQLSGLFRETLTPDPAWVDEPIPGFYARLSQSLAQSQQPRRTASLWSLLSIDAAFGRRVAFGSLMTLALVGGYLVSRESNMGPDLQGPEAIMASHDLAAPHDATVERDRMMVALASYETR